MRCTYDGKVFIIQNSHRYNTKRIFNLVLYILMKTETLNTVCINLLIGSLIKIRAVSWDRKRYL